MSDYTPDEQQVREQYTQEQPPQIGSVAEKRAEFDRFLAKTKADTLREAAYEFAGGPWRDQFAADGVDDDVSAVQSTCKWFQKKADRIERGENVLGYNRFADGARWQRLALLEDDVIERVADVLERMDGMDLEDQARAALTAALGIEGGE